MAGSFLLWKENTKSFAAAVVQLSQRAARQKEFESSLKKLRVLGSEKGSRIAGPCCRSEIMHMDL